MPVRPDPDHDAVDGPSPGNRHLRLEHLRVGLSGPSLDPAGAPAAPAAEPWHMANALAPFVAWLATQGIDEAARRRHRDAVERYLGWCLADTGSIRDRRRRYARDVERHDPQHLASSAEGLGWWVDHRRILAQTTLPADG